MELFKLTAHEIRELIAKKEISGKEALCSQYQRIGQVEDKVGAYITLCEEAAQKKAERIDAKRAAGEKLPAFAGVPMAIKDNICTKGVKTTCASHMLENFVPPYQATVAAKLEQEDAILLGKLNMDEFAMGSSTENSYFKDTKNPYDLTRVPGGSSGGSAAAVAADEAYFALGSDTGGSIRQPASFCGVVGFKPTYGMVSRYGLIAFASSLDQIGTLTKDVRDCAEVLDIITGADKMDASSIPGARPHFAGELGKDVKGLRIGIPEEYIGEGVDAKVRQAILDTAKVYETLGAKVETCSLPMNDYALAAYYLISSAEASSNLARFDGVRYGFRSPNYHNMEEMYLATRSEGFGDEVKRRIMLGTFVLSSGYYDAYYKKAQQARTLIKQDFDRAFARYDVLLSPAAPTTAWKIGEKISDPVQMYAQDICTVSINIAGLPGMVLPCGRDAAGLPIGAQLIGKPMGDQTLIRAGYAFEQASEFHKIRPEL